MMGWCCHLADGWKLNTKREESHYWKSKPRVLTEREVENIRQTQILFMFTLATLACNNSSVADWILEGFFFQYRAKLQYHNYYNRKYSHP